MQARLKYNQDGQRQEIYEPVYQNGRQSYETVSASKKALYQMTLLILPSIARPWRFLI